MTALPTRPDVSAAMLRAELADLGFVVVRQVGGLDGAIDLLTGLGELMPQYDGQITHEVRNRPGNEGRSYSQSTNLIQAHTEAPGWSPSPAWLALFCHRQATCGGGQTDLLDVADMLPRLGRRERALLSRPLFFPAPASSGGDGVRSALLADGVLRFSYNLLTSGSFDPEIGAEVPPEQLPLGNDGARLAIKVSRLFEELRTRILIPEGALLIWDNQRMLHARSSYADKSRHLTRFWIGRTR